MIDAFIKRWESSAASERANYQLFLTELCAVLEVEPPHPAGADDALNAYVFEKSVRFTFPSNVSPYFLAKEWEDARRTLPEDVFRQEYMAEFLEDSAGVFRGVDGCLIPGETLNVQRSTLKLSLGAISESYFQTWCS
ncbi:MAG: hypothetical protein GX565_00650 [Lentisphaerae bacterium]|nr:hypothetical protein [Lentisphaerota bacterium]